MSVTLAYALSFILISIAALHLYWGLGGFWPGRDEATLVDMVIGAPAGTPIPPLWACLIVVACLLVPAVSALIVSTGFDRGLPRLIKWIPTTALWCSAFVFLARGLVTYFTPIFLGGKKTAFYQLNLAYYSPFCLLLGAGLISVWILRNRVQTG